MPDTLTAAQPFFPWATNTGVAYGQYNPWTGHPESAVDINPNYGQTPPVGLVEPGQYLPAYSTPYEAVFQGQSGYYEAYSHVNVSPALQPGTTYGAGTAIGTVQPPSNGSYSGTTGNGQTITYARYGSPFSFGVYSDPTGADTWDISKSIDPVAFLASLSGGAAGSGDPAAPYGRNPNGQPMTPGESGDQGGNATPVNPPYSPWTVLPGGGNPADPNNPAGLPQLPSIGGWEKAGWTIGVGVALLGVLALLVLVLKPNTMQLMQAGGKA